MKKYLIIIIALFPELLQAQTNADKSKFEIIQAAVNFYATDSVAFKSVPTVAMAKCQPTDYTCLLDFCKANNLKGVDAKINAWIAIPCKTKEELKALKDKITSELTAKKYRTKLPGYKEYSKNMETLVEQFRPEKTTTILLDSNKNTVKPKEIGFTEKNTDAKGNLLSWTAIFIALVSLGICFVLSVRKNKITKSNINGNIISAEEIAKLESKIAALNAVLSLKPNMSEVNTLEKRVHEIKNSLEQQEKQIKTFGIAKHGTETVKTNIISSANALYAKMLDIPNGFSNDILKKEQNGEQVYEIRILTQDTAQYTVSNNKAAQEYALNDMEYILGRGCTLANQPFANCSIITTQTGNLIKSSEDWIIEKKAVIEFR